MSLVFLLYAFFASIFVICKAGLEYAQPLFLVGSRMLIAGTLILGYQLWRNRSELNIKKNILWRLFWLAFFNIYLTNVCEVWGLNYLSPAKTCLIYSLSPFVAALFSYLLFNERLSQKKWAGLLVGFAGFFPILLANDTGEIFQNAFWGFSWPELSVCTAAVSSVYGWTLLRQLVKDNNVSFLTANGLSMLGGGALALIHSFVVENWDPFPVAEFIPFMECTLLLLLISNFIAYNLYGYLLKRYTSTFMSLAGLTTPLFAAAFAWLYFGEVVSLPFYISLGVISVGLFIFYQEELKESEEVVTAVSYG